MVKASDCAADRVLMICGRHCRPYTPEGQKQDILIIEDAVSLISSPSLPRTHSRPYTPLKYSPQQQGPANSHQCSAQAKTTQHRLKEDAVWQSSSSLQDRRKHADRLSISSDSDGREKVQSLSLSVASHQGKQHGSKPSTNGKVRRQGKHRRKHQSAEESQSSINAANLRKGSNGMQGAQAPADAVHSSMHNALPSIGNASVPSHGDSINWISASSNATFYEHRPPQHSVALLQQDLERAQAAELHYLVRFTL